jgi:hypothetical protein
VKNQERFGKGGENNGNGGERNLGVLLSVNEGGMGWGEGRFGKRAEKNGVFLKVNYENRRIMLRCRHE